MHRQGIPTWHPQTLESPSPARWLGTRGYRLESAFTGGNEKTLVPDLRRDPGGALPSSSLPLSQPRVLSILTCKSLYPGPLPQVRDVAGFLQASAVAQTPWRQRALHSWGLWWLCSGPARSPHWARSPLSFLTSLAEWGDTQEFSHFRTHILSGSSRTFPYHHGHRQGCPSPQALLL